MNNTLIKILQSREDLSDYLFHFTKGRNAFPLLQTIASEKCLRDLKETGYICFTEAPLLSLTNMFKIFEKYEDPLYAPYGIALKKEDLFALGGRNVIYGLPEEINNLKNESQWRFEKYMPTQKDFTWLREWRVPLDIIPLTEDNCFIVTKAEEELESFMFNEDGVFDIEFDGCVADGQFWGTAYGQARRAYKGVSIESIETYNSMSKSEIQKLLENQDKDDIGELNLGGFSF